MGARGKAVDGNALRRRAEQRLRREKGTVAVSEVQAQKLIHELQVHKIELELQNEELLRARSQEEEVLARYTALYDFAPIGYCTLDPLGRIIEMNLAAARFLGKPRGELIRRRLGSHVASASAPALKDGLAQVFAHAGPVIWELHLKEEGRILRIEAIAADPGKTCYVALVDISKEMALQRAHDEAQARQAEMSQRLVAVQEEERRRLSMELHDHTSGNLAALDLLLRTLARQFPTSLLPASDGAATIADIQALLRATAAEIHAVCGDLRPPLLDFAGVVPALDSYARSFTERYGIAVHLEVAGRPKRLPPEIETTLFRIAQEALTNCAKHAGASAASVRLNCSGERTVLEIADDGVGFAPGQVSKLRLGLRVMRERAEFAGGAFAVDAQPGKGTRIRVEF